MIRGDEDKESENVTRIRDIMVSIPYTIRDKAWQHLQLHIGISIIFGLSGTSRR
jgi:hypothetical protein